MASFRLGLIVLVNIVPVLMAQQPTLIITSPPDRSVVHSGESFSVLTEGKGATFVAVGVFPPNPIPWPEMRTEPPFTFTFKVPEDMTPGFYLFTATGKTNSQQQISSNQVQIDIERPDRPVSIKTDPEGPFELRPGEEVVIDVTGTYKNKSTADLNRSTQTTFVSEDPNIVAIHKYGDVVGVGEGTTNVVIRVGEKVIRQRVTVKSKE